MGLPIRGQKVSWHPGPLPEEERSAGEGEKLSCLVMLSSSPGPVCSPLLPPEAKLHRYRSRDFKWSWCPGPGCREVAVAGGWAHGGLGGPAEQ